MTLLKAYLLTPRAKRALSKKLGEQGFSLIELVVVVAVLAILSAVAIPSFTSINAKARSSAATNTIATIAKECAVKFANGTPTPAFSQVSLDGYTSFLFGTSATACSETLVITALSTDEATLPTFTYNAGTGVKTCTYTAADADDVAAGAALGCKSIATANNTGTW
jgi:type IV pilus assembly protein PilA